MKTIGKTFLIVLAIWLISVLLIGRVMGQHSHINDSFERFETMRLLPPAKLLDVNPITKIVKYKISDKNEVRFGELVIDKDTQINAAIYGDYTKGDWWLLYCSKDSHLYGIWKVQPEQIKR